MEALRSTLKLDPLQTEFTSCGAEFTHPVKPTGLQEELQGPSPGEKVLGGGETVALNWGHSGLSLEPLLPSLIQGHASLFH